MGRCIFCGQPAGLLRKAHKECESKNTEGKKEIRALVKSAFSNSAALGSAENTIEEICRSHFIDKSGLRTLIVQEWEKAVDRAFDDGILTREEESALTELQTHFSLSQDELDRNGAYTKVVKGAILRDVLDGLLPAKVNVEGVLPFNLQKAEKLVWLFRDVDYYEQRTRRQYVGRSSGVSIRIAKGVYYRTGSFKGHAVDRTETVRVDKGLLALTNKHLYFAGPSKSFRIKYDKIVSFEPYSDGIGVQRDAGTAKPQMFITSDGWFTYNLVANLAQN